MEILLVGLNHKRAPLEIRERASFSSEQTAEALPQLKRRIGESVILSTCNRTEIYATSEHPESATHSIRRFVADYHGIAPDTISPYFYCHSGSQAVRHLFRVASGLDSMIIGESQILGQVRDALTAASEAESVQVALVGLFHAAIRVGRKVREETEISRNALSISYAGVQLAQRVLGNLQGRRVLLIGAGEAGQLVANALRTAGIGDLMIANRTLSRAEELVHSLGGTVVPFAEVEASLERADIIITATDAPEYVITKEMTLAALDGRPRDALFMFDLAVPRDIEPEVASIEGVRLYNIDDLSAIAEENLEERRRAAVQAEEIVDAELERFMRWWESLDVVPIIRDMRQQAEAIRRRELARALKKLPGLSPEQAAVVEALTRSITNKLLHDPTIALKQDCDNDQLQMARQLFRLWESS